MSLWRSATSARVSGESVRIDAARCVRSRLDRSHCRACADACPEDAIALDSFPTLVAARCTSCRLCEAACPAGAIEGDARDLETLSAELGRTPHPVLGCQAPGVDAHVRTGCLGFLELEGLLALALELPDGLTLNLTHCRDCPNGPAVTGLERMVGEARRLTGAVGATNLRIATSTEALAFRENPLSRRQFFSIAAKRCAAAATAAVPLQQVGSAAPDGGTKRLPSRRRLLLKNLSALPGQRRASVADALFPTLAFESACNNCMACVGVCPTGAIAASQTDPLRPEFIAARCTGCGICAEFCNVGAIGLSSRAAPKPESKPATFPASAVS